MRLAKTACLILAFVGVVAASRADTLRLKSGLTYTGRVVKLNDFGVYSSVNPHAGKGTTGRIWLVDDGPRRISVPGRQGEEDIEEKQPLISGVPSFKFPQHKTGQANFPSQIGSFSRIEEFDEFGHGMVQLQTPDGPVNVYLGIVELRPDYVRIESLSHDWSFSRTTQSLGPDVIERLLLQKVNRSKVEERRALVAFYEDAEMYRLAKQEVEQLEKDFPDQKKWCDGISAEMHALDTTRALNELTRRRTAGQHLLTYGAAKTFPLEHVSAEIHREVTQIVGEYDALRERRSDILLQLDMLQSQLPAEEVAKLRPMRSLLSDELHAVENMDRLAPYEQIAKDPGVGDSEKLALAYSSWVVGPSDAVESLSAAVRMWDMRFLILEYLRTTESPARRAEIIQTLEATEDFSVERLARMVEYLPMLEDSAPIPPTVPTTVEIASDGAGAPLSYVVILPKEYNPQHTYPLLVVLHARGAVAEDEARWWAGDLDREGQAQRRGFITIAPRYVPSKQSEYEYDLSSHRAVLGAIRHAMRTHRVDADRVVLAGHGMGGDACFDLGMSLPDVFAGVAPICGKSQKYCKFYYGNAMKSSWYVVAGQRDRDTVAMNMRDLNRYFLKGSDIIYCEYKERGFEPYPEELPRLMDWAETVRRKPLKEYMEFEANTLRSFDNHFHWVQAGSLPPELFQPIVWEDRKKKVRELPINGKITAGGPESCTVYVTHPGKTTSILFSPEMVNFEARVRVHVNSREQFNGLLKPSAEALLEDLRTRADRKRLFWTRLDLN